jgi:hypothetical protein
VVRLLTDHAKEKGTLEKQEKWKIEESAAIEERKKEFLEEIQQRENRLSADGNDQRARFKRLDTILSIVIRKLACVDRDL